MKFADFVQLGRAIEAEFNEPNYRCLDMIALAMPSTPRDEQVLTCPY
jgi:hypothetical protein